MAGVFWFSWALWVKMTFVLAMSIAIVFCVGYGKLLWQNRLIRRSEIAEQLKSLAHGTRRSSNYAAQADTKINIPFGVRALQKGVRVEGIWVSNQNTPVQLSPTLGSLPVTNPDFTPLLSGVSTNLSPSRHSLVSSAGYSTPKNAESGDLGQRATTRELGNDRQDFKPKNSSHLRFSSSRDISKARPDYGKHISSGGEGVPVSGDSSRSSLNTAKSDIADLEQHSPHPRSHSQAPPHVNAQTDQNRSAHELPNTPMRHSLPLHATGLDYFSMPLNSLEHNTYADTHAREVTSVNPNERPSTADQPRPIAPVQSPALSWSPPPNTRLPGVHMNQKARRVNSGFELLPAYFLGRPKISPDEEKGEGKDDRNDGRKEDIDGIRPSRFQRLRTSLNVRRSFGSKRGR